MADQDSTKRTTSKKTSAKKPTKKASTTKKSPGARASAPRAEPGTRVKASEVAAAAARQFAELSSKTVEGVTGLQRSDDGWVVELDVLELRRVPETTDVLATYEISVSSSGELEGYRRVHRYVRGQAEDPA
ncbi:gas vesicle protein GvpO [Nocardioides sp. GXQ0305]|uniref:gas vesicle protein GvpO n=1 Tax=Nocardioides sp. GXQ0305 TaxID=3423912 RepID=UPI003D7D0B20